MNTICAGQPLKRRIRRFAGLWFSLITAITLRAQPEARPAQPVSQGQWQLTPLVREGDAIPDKPGARFQLFGEFAW